MPLLSRSLTCAVGLTLGGYLVLGFAGGQDGPPGNEKGKGKKVSSEAAEDSGKHVDVVSLLGLSRPAEERSAEAGVFGIGWD